MAGSQHDQLEVLGTVSLAGNLNVTLGSGYTPTIGSQFTILATPQDVTMSQPVKVIWSSKCKLQVIKTNSLYIAQNIGSVGAYCHPGSVGIKR